MRRVEGEGERRRRDGQDSVGLFGSAPSVWKGRKWWTDSASRTCKDTNGSESVYVGIFANQQSAHKNTEDGLADDADLQALVEYLCAPASRKF